MPNITFSLAAELAPARLDDLTLDLMRDLGRIGTQARPVEAQARPGERGVVSTIGNFVIETLLSGKSAAALLEVLKAYVAREKSLRVSITKPDGTKVEIDAKNVGSATVAEFLGAVKTIT